MEKKLYTIAIAITLCFAPLFAHAADLTISPSTGTFSVGDQVSVKVMVTTGTPINAISSTINVPTSIFSIESIAKDTSILNFWVTQPSFSNTTGVVSFEGVSLGGFTGKTGNVVTLRLRAKKEGTGTVSIKSAQILANDGQGTNVTSAVKSSGTFTIVKAAPKPVEVVPPPVVEVVPEAPPQKAPELTAPEIIFVKKYGEQAIAGTSKYPKSQALITFVDGNGYKVFINSTTDEKGEFYTLVPKSLRHGPYKVSAVVVTSDLSNSLKSNELEVAIGNWFSDIGAWPIAIASLIILILLGMLLHKSKDDSKEKEEVTDILKKSLSLIEEEVRANKDPKEGLKDVEKILEKEIKDINSL